MRLNPEQSLHQVPESAIFPKFGLSTVEIPGSRVFVTPPSRRIRIPELCTFANSRLRRSQVSENREFPALEKHALKTSLSSMFRGWRVFLNSPTIKKDISVGELGKNLRTSNPRNIEVVNYRVVALLCGKKVLVMARKYSWRCFVIFSWFADPLTLCEIIVELASESQV
jgi:hypothetical protein